MPGAGGGQARSVQQTGSYTEKVVEESEKYAERGGLNESSISNQRLEDRRFQEQAFLLAHYDKIENKNLDTTYKNFHKLRGDPATLMNKLTTNKFNQEFMKVSHEDMAKLVPMVRVFKVFVDENGNETDMAELKFNEYTTEQSVENVRKTGLKGEIQQRVTNIEDITQVKAGRGAGVGLKSFEWEFMGSNMEERSNNIAATMKLYFQTIQDLTENRELSGENNKRTVSFLDLVAPVSKFKREEAEAGVKYKDPREHNEAYFRVKIMVGWSAPKTADIDPELRKAIKNTRRLMTLNLKDHELNFNQNGTVDMTINFHAATNAAMLEPESNVFLSVKGDGGSQETSAEKERRLAGKKEKVDKLKKKLEKTESENKKSAIKARIEWIEDKVGKTEEALQKERTEMYNRLIRRIFDAGRVYEVKNVDPKFLGKFIEDGWLYNTVLTEEEPLELKAGRSKNSEGEFEEDEEVIASSRAKKAKRENKIEITELSSANFLSKEKEKVKERTKKSEEDSSTVSDEESVKNHIVVEDGTASFPFFYLGDLLDAALEPFVEKNTQSSKFIKFIVGDLHIINPYTGSPDLVNIADLPVAYDLFFDWFVDTVIKPKKDRFLTKYFIESAFQELITRVLGSDAMGGVLRQKAKISMHNFSYPTKNGKDQILSTPKSGERLGEVRETLNTNTNSDAFSEASDRGKEILFKRQEGNAQSKYAFAETVGGYGPVDADQKGGTIRHIDALDENAEQAIQSFRDVEGALDYQVIYPTNNSAPYMDATEPGAEYRDMKNGIYWFNIGNDRGIFREMNFSRRDQPYAREARIMEGEVSRFTRLKEVYEVEIRTHGNAMFLPGDLIFVNPSVIGFGGPQSEIAQKTGLVGYYQIITVDNVIERGQFETVLNAVWTADGTGGGAMTNTKSAKGHPTNENSETPQVNQKK